MSLIEKFSYLLKPLKHCRGVALINNSYYKIEWTKTNQRMEKKN